MIIEKGIADHVRHSQEKWDEVKHDSKGSSYSTSNSKNIVTFRINGKTPCYYESKSHIRIEKNDELVVGGKFKRKEFKIWGYNNLTEDFYADQGTIQYFLLAITCVILTVFFIYYKSDSKLPDLQIFKYFDHIFYGFIALCLIVSVFSLRTFFKRRKFRKLIKQA